MEIRFYLAASSSWLCLVNNINAKVCPIVWVIIQGTAGKLRGWVLLQTGSNLTIRNGAQAEIELASPSISQP